MTEEQAYDVVEEYSQFELWRYPEHGVPWIRRRNEVVAPVVPRAV